MKNVAPAETAATDDNVELPAVSNAGDAQNAPQAAAKEVIERVGKPDGIEIMNSNNERWRIRSNDRQRMVDVLGGIERPTGRLRIEINPLRA